MKSLRDIQLIQDLAKGIIETLLCCHHSLDCFGYRKTLLVMGNFGTSLGPAPCAVISSVSFKESELSQNEKVHREDTLCKLVWLARLPLYLCVWLIIIGISVVGMKSHLFIKSFKVENSLFTEA